MVELSNKLLMCTRLYSVIKLIYSPYIGSYGYGGHMNKYQQIKLDANLLCDLFRMNCSTTNCRQFHPLHSNRMVLRIEQGIHLHCSTHHPQHGFISDTVWNSKTSPTPTPNHIDAHQNASKVWTPPARTKCVIVCKTKKCECAANAGKQVATQHMHLHSSIPSSIKYTEYISSARLDVSSLYFLHLISRLHGQMSTLFRLLKFERSHHTISVVSVCVCECVCAPPSL